MQLNRESIISHGSALSPSLKVFGRLNEFLRDPNTDLEQVVALVRIDQALSFQVIRLSNSVMFGRKNPCDSLESAVERLGFREIHRIVGLAAMHQTFQQDLITYNISSARLWENSVATAVAMDALAEQSGRDGPSAYAAGLLRNVGRVIINSITGGSRYPGEQAFPLIAAWEQESYGMSGVEVSAVLLEHWNFSHDWVEAVREHLDPLHTPVVQPGAVLLNLAAGLAEGWGTGLPGEATYWSPSKEKLSAAGLSEQTLAAANNSAQNEFVRLRDALAA